MQDEHNFLMLCLRSLIAGEAAERAKAMAQSGRLDWERIASAADMHQVRPALYARLQKMQPMPAPQAIMTRLNRIAKETVSRNLQLMEATRRLLTLFAEAGIRVLPLKGPIQAARLYGNLGLREIADLDFLIARDDFAAAKRLLTATGHAPLKVFTPGEEEAFLKRHTVYEYPFIDLQRRIVVELHWNLLPAHSAFKLKDAYLWERASKTTQYGAAFETLSDEDLMIYMCIHNEKHNWRELKFLLDAALLIKGSRTLNWADVLERMKRLEREATLQFTLFFCHALFGSRMPEAIRIDSRLQRILLARAALAKGRLFRAGFRLPGFREWREEFRDLAETTPFESGRAGAGGSVLLYARSLLTPECIDRTLFPPLPSGMSAVYCAARVLRFISFHANIHLPKKKDKRLPV